MFKLLNSVTKSMGRAVYNDPEVQNLLSRHPYLFRFIRKRLTPDEKFGLYLTLGMALTAIFIFLFFGVVEDLIGQDPLIQSDLRIINLVQIFRTPSFNNVMLLLPILANGRLCLLVLF